MAIQPEPKPTIPPSTMPLISPPTLLSAYLSQTPPVRPSNRTPTQTLPININTSSLTHCNGSSLLKLGETTVVCGIRAELLPVSEIAHYRASETARNSAQENEEDPDANYEAVTLNNLLVPNLELGTNSHPSFPSNVAPSVTAQSISQRILSLLHTSRLVRISDLEIRHTSSTPTSNLDPDDPGYIEPEKNVLKAYWTLYIDCVALSYGGEGGVFDAAVMAVIAALRDVRLPSARWDDDEKRIFCNPDISQAHALSLRCLPCPLSFGIFTSNLESQSGQQPQSRINGAVSGSGKGSSIILLNTDSFEDDVCQEKGSVVVDCSDQTGKCKILRIEKAGGMGSFGVEDLKEVIEYTQQRWKEWRRVLEAGGG